ncbi:hypothetical protein, partial [Zunongwangia profunda]|uniref:hypothetical protein n=2 Tax=Zunongwangia profunda TaxID=398743 RepID=UPI001D18EB1C
MKMIFKTFVIRTYLILFLSISVFSQTEYEAVQLPEVFPGSPEASEIGKFGDLPINLSTGTMNFNIPVFQIASGKYNYPLNISYTYGGLMLNDIPGKLGLGWSLTSGLIVRQMRGRPDEDTGGYLGSKIGEKIKNVINGNYPKESPTLRDSLDRFIGEGRWDGLPDKFVARAGDMNVTFYFNEDGEVITKPYKPYIIRMIDQDIAKGFIIIDDLGIKYTFSESEVSNPIYTAENQPSYPVGSYKSSWKISSIEYPNGKSLTFNYSIYNYYQKITTQSLTNFRTASAGLSSQLSNHHSKNFVSTKLLQNINFSNGSINFEHTIQNPSNPKEAYLVGLKNISIYNNYNKIKSFDFIYDDLMKTRKLLRNVRIDDNQLYEFEYLGNPQDNIPFYKQDFWGFVNDNETGLLLPNNDFGETYSLRKPSFDNSKVGALWKIVYPTGGSTQITYEPNTYDPGEDHVLDDFYKGSGLCSDFSNALHKSVGIMSRANQSGLSDVKTFQVDSETYMRLNLTVEKNAWPGGRVRAGLRRVNGSGAEIDCEGKQDCDKCSKMEIYYDENNTPQSSDYQEIQKSITTEDLLLLPGTYEIYVETYGSNNCGTCGLLSGNVNISLSDNGISRSREVGGIRISKVQDFDGKNNSITKIYEYESDNGISYGSLFRSSNLFRPKNYVLQKYVLNPGEQLGDVESSYVTQYNSGSNLPLGGFMGSHINYKKVEEKYLDKFNENNGSKVNKFTNYTTIADSDPEVLDLMPDERSYMSGRIIEELFFNRNEDTIKKVNYSYKFSKNLGFNPILNYGVSYLVKADWTDFGDEFNSDYVLFSGNNVDQLVARREINYYPTGIAKTGKFFFYDFPYQHLREHKIINSKEDSIITKFYYPYDLDSISNITSSETLTLNKLIAYNRLTEVVEKTEKLKYKNLDEAVELSSIRFHFKSFDQHIIAPEKTFTKKGSFDKEHRITYHSYDSYGNPLEVSKSDGPLIFYLWGYHGQYPIAKIENTTEAALESELGLLKNVNESDLQSINNLRSNSAFKEAMIT